MIDEKHVLHIEFSEAELAVRLLEATGGGERPRGTFSTTSRSPSPAAASSVC